MSYTDAQNGIRFLPEPNSNKTGGFDFGASDGIQLASQSDYAHVTIHVIAVDDPPGVIATISDKDLDEDASELKIDLYKIFEDPDNDINQMQISVIHNSSPELVQTQINHFNLRLTIQKNQSGMAQIFLLANSNGKSVTSHSACNR